MKAVVCLLAVSAAITMPLSAAAESESQNAIIVTATRSGDDAARLPGHVTLITAEQIRTSPMKTLPELLALEAGVTTRSLFGNNAVNATVGMRGFGVTDTQNTLVLLNGRRLNDIDLSDVDFTAIPLADIERIEILHGGGGVLYGDGAVGGVVNIVTRQSGRSGLRGTATVAAGSYASQKLDANVELGTGPFAFGAYVNGIRSDGYRDNNELRQGNFLGDLRVNGARDSGFLRFGATRQYVQLPGARRVDPSTNTDQLHDDPRGTSTPNDYGKQYGYFVNGGWTSALGNATELIVDAGYRRKNPKAFFGDYTTFCGGCFSNFIDTTFSTWSLTPRLKTRYSLLGVPSTLQVGVDYYHSWYDSDRALNPHTANDPFHRLHVEQKSSAVYGQQTNEWGAHTLLLGARVQHVKQEAQDQVNIAAPGGGFETQAAPFARSDTENMTELGLRHRLSDSWSLFEKFTRSVRFATVDEIWGEFDSSFTRIFSPLKPQTAHSFDFGTDYRSGGTAFSASVYRMRLKNEIHFTPFDPVTGTGGTNDNLDPTRRYGATLSGSIPVTDSLRIKSDLAYTRAKFRDGAFAGNEIPLVPRYAGALSVLWKFAPTYTLVTTEHYIGHKRFDNDQQNSFRQMPDYHVLDMKLSASLGHGWRWEAAVNNVFDKTATFDYAVRSLNPATPDAFNAYPLPGRNYSLSVTGEF